MRTLMMAPPNSCPRFSLMMRSTGMYAYQQHRVGWDPLQQDLLAQTQHSCFGIPPAALVPQSRRHKAQLPSPIRTSIQHADTFKNEKQKVEGFTWIRFLLRRVLSRRYLLPGVVVARRRGHLVPAGEAGRDVDDGVLGVSRRRARVLQDDRQVEALRRQVLRRHRRTMFCLVDFPNFANC